MTGNPPPSTVPRLRFPAFHEAGDWDLLPLGSVAEPVSEKVGTTTCVPMSVTTGVGLVSQEDKFGRIIAGDSYKNYIKLQTNDFAYNKSATKDYPQGYIARYAGTRDAGVPGSIFTCFRPNAATVIPEFLDYLFHGNYHGRWLRKYITIGARAHGALSVSDDDLLAMPVPFPPAKVLREEQQKIADCVGSLDDLITTEGRKLEALGQHRQGLRQQLFPQPGETVPRLRFPECQDAPEWEDRSLRSVCERIMDGTHFSPKTKDGPRPYLTSRNIRDGRLDLSTISFISEDEHRDIYARCPVKKLDVLLTKDGANTGTCAINTLEYEFSLLSSVAVLRGDAERITQEFLYQTIANDRTQSTIINSMAGQAITRITLEKLGNYVIPLPTLSEQQKIAECLASLDDQIAAQARKIDACKQHKQGLLQQLFPAPETP